MTKKGRARKSYNTIARVVMCSATILSSLCVAFSARSQTFQQIDVPNAVSTEANGINDAGQVVGSFIDTSNQEHGFVWSGGKFITIDYPGAYLTIASGINNAGQIVGAFGSIQGRGPNQGFLLSGIGGSFSPIVYPGAITTAANGLNNKGSVLVGSFSDTQGNGHGFVWSGGSSYIQFDAPGSHDTIGIGINDVGQIAGAFYAATPTAPEHGFLLSAVGGSFTQIDYPGAPETTVGGINNAGQVVGWAMGKGAWDFCSVGTTSRTSFFRAALQLSP